jgi:hypothetical protein
MWYMVRIEVAVTASVGGFCVDFGDQCCHFPDDWKIQKRNELFLTLFS